MKRPTLALILLLILGAALIAAAESPADKLENTLRWTTASEVDNFGFDVYRATSEEGPFDLLTETPIEGAGNSDVPSQYSFVDDTIAPGVEYYYYVDSISMNGERERFTPVMKAAAKYPPEERSEDSEENSGKE